MQSRGRRAVVFTGGEAAGEGGKGKAEDEGGGCEERIAPR